YPFLAHAIAKHAPKATLIDPAPAVAQQLERRLAALDLATPQTAPGTERFFASGADAAREAVLRTLWSDPRARLYEMD
ncbi:MAG TPA: glutamate racemase, partial [Sutterella wadsworthensis]|nr:glutamate racemase [Sutterella wadsworthensis]